MRFVTAAILLITAPNVSSAAWGGIEDGNAHPMVGAMYADFTGNGQIEYFELICSGSYAGASTNGDFDVFLTAGHCIGPLVVFFGITDFWVSFDPDPLGSGGMPTNLIRATDFAWDPRFGHDSGNLYDSGVLLLPAGSVQSNHPGLPPVVLPPAGYLNDLKRSGDLQHSVMELVGYGVVPTWQQPGGTQFAFDGVRRTSYSKVKGLTLAWLNFNQNVNATESGGLCFGDSGSPQFVPDTLMIVSTTTGGDPNCRANNYNYRLDTVGAREFLGQFVNLP
ncbi:MAG: hypothetical protein OEN22_00800 [Gammaproteobacteria bacterium]|nr:hypothetical protein [Gammaproteobacteria bacterium]